jgi:hypothetical protein
MPESGTFRTGSIWLTMSAPGVKQKSDLRAVRSTIDPSDFVRWELMQLDQVRPVVLYMN